MSDVADPTLEDEPESGTIEVDEDGDEMWFPDHQHDDEDDAE